MARVTFIDGIDTVRGALDSVKDGQSRRARLVCKWHYWGEKWIDKDGSKVHLVYTYHFHEGPWAEGATRNREMIKAAQRMAHDIERVCYHPEEFGDEDIEQARIWQDQYAEYRKTIPKGSTNYKHFYGWMYTEIYRGMRVRGLEELVIPDDDPKKKHVTRAECVEMNKMAEEICGGTI